MKKHLILTAALAVTFASYAQITETVSPPVENKLDNPEVQRKSRNGKVPDGSPLM